MRNRNVQDPSRVKRVGNSRLFLLPQIKQVVILGHLGGAKEVVLNHTLLLEPLGLRLKGLNASRERHVAGFQTGEGRRSLGQFFSH